MSRRKFLKAATTTAAAATAACAHQSQHTGGRRPSSPRRNLLFIFTDEQRRDTMAAYGNTKIDTPNLNRLAHESVVFEKAYVTQPVCTPSRASIMTGRYPHTIGCTHNNVPLPSSTPCLTEIASGYQTAYFGKWHLGDEVFPQHGFQRWVSCEEYTQHFSEGRDRNARSSYHHWLVSKGYTPTGIDDDSPGSFGRSLVVRFPEPHCKPAFLAEESVKWLRGLDPDRPFIGYINFLEPHMPFTGPRDGQYASRHVDLPANYPNIPDERNHLKYRLLHAIYRQQGEGTPLNTEARWRRLIANYWGLVSQVDTAVGAILDALAENGLAESTIVVFTSDHGDMMGSHQLVAKTVMFEEAVSVPLLFRIPGVSPRRERQSVSQVDLTPTLLDLLGAPVPSELQGQSLRPLIEHGTPPRQRDVFIEWSGPDSGAERFEGSGQTPEALLQFGSPETLAAAMRDPIRTVVTLEGWKLNYSPTLGQHELFNLDEDPFEVNNLYGQEATHSTVKDLKNRLRGWGVSTGDEIASAI